MLDKVIEHGSKWIGRVILACFGMVMMALVLVTTYGVFMRYIVNDPISWIEEIQMILVVWTTFLGICITILDKGNISIALLVDKLPDGLRKAVHILGWCVIAAVIVKIAQLEFGRLSTLLSSSQITATLHIPKWVQYSVVAGSCVVMLVNHCLVGIKSLRQGKKEEA